MSNAFRIPVVISTECVTRSQRSSGRLAQLCQTEAYASRSRSRTGSKVVGSAHVTMARLLLVAKVMRTRLVTWRSSLYAALGLVVTACGGNTVNPGDPGAGGAGGVGGAGGAGGSGSGPSSCVNPRPVLGIDGNETGFVSCDGSVTHRQAVR